MRKIGVLAKHANPEVDRPIYFLKPSEILPLLELGRAERVSPWLVRLFSTKPDNIGHANFAAMGPDGSMRDWAIRPSGGVFVWQLKTQRTAIA